jgi:hypothetical protein
MIILSELETQLHIAQRPGYMKKDDLVEKVDMVFAMLGGLIKSLRERGAQ